MKRCSKCGVEKNESLFYFRNKKKSILRSACKECTLEAQSHYNQNDEYQKQYYQNNKSRKQFARKNNRSKRNQDAKIRRKNDPMYRVRQNISNTINAMLK